MTTFSLRKWFSKPAKGIADASIAGRRLGKALLKNTFKPGQRACSFRTQLVLYVDLRDIITGIPTVSTVTMISSDIMSPKLW
jgi:hypothetical protein